MSNISNTSVTMAVDTKRNGIRIHKPMFHMLGEPKYIQFLINPFEGVVVIQTVDREISGSQTHHIIEKRMQSDHSYEIYSRSFIQKLREVAPEIKDGSTYRLTGNIILSPKMAVFSLKSLQRTDR